MTLSILAAVLTGVVAVGLANPTLIPGSDAEQYPAADSTGAGGAAQSGQSGSQAPAPVDAVDHVTPVQSAADSVQPVTTASVPVTADETPTPRPDFTPAVQSATGGGSQRDGDEHEEEDEWDDD